MATRTGYRTVYPAQPWNRDSTVVLQGAMQGKTNNVFDAALTTGTSVTHLSFPLIGPLSWIGVVPTNTYAASLKLPWADAQTDGAAILHSVTASTSASYRILVVG